VIPRFRELAFDTLAFWRESATSVEELEKWVSQQREKIAGATWTTAMEGSVAAFEITYTMQDGKVQLKRVLVEGQPVDGAVNGLVAKFGSFGAGSGTGGMVA
jgi:hypothetical protein